ncbi:MAG TPA: phage terminase large subunit [Acetobacteraceae bacterium]|nr:phage terminase large subunit [Acetobacteraceae bacterium]
MADASAERGDARHFSLVEWASLVLGSQGLRPARHHLRLIERLEEISSGAIDRLMVLMPPGSAKSTFVSVLFPAWWFVAHPRSSVIAASHTAELAVYFGRQVRNIVAEYSGLLDYGLSPQSRAAGRWRTTRGGEYFAAGIRGPITGRRADLVIIDDPIKSWLEADRVPQRDHLWNWYRSELATRLKPKGRIVLVMTRWHEDDLAGRLLEAAADEWTLLRLAAMAEANDPLGRSEGEPLWLEWQDAKELERKRLEVGERVWTALYQQSPRPAQGQLFKPGRISVIESSTSELSRIVRAWDLAATVPDGSNDPDWTVGVKLARDDAGRFIILDVVRLRGGPLEVETAIKQAASLDGRAVLIALPEDPGQAGKTQASHLVRMLAGHKVSATRETGSKLVRALPVAAQVEAGNFAMLRAQWNHALIQELAEFPVGRKDDQVDALARAFNTLADAPESPHRINLALLGR